MWLYSISAILFTLDRFLKYIVTQSDDFFIFGGVFVFTLTKNSGIAFGIPIPTIISVPLTIAFFVLIAFYIFSHHLSRLPSFMFFVFFIFFGGASNYFDRIRYGYVIDYFTIHVFSRELSFNLADAMIVAGVLFLFFRSSRRMEDIRAVNRKTYDMIAHSFSESREKPLWEEVCAFRQYVKNGARVADIGCGNGRLLQLFEGMDVDYVGIDTSSALLDEARLQVTSYQLLITNTALQFIHADMTHLPFVGASFDHVFMIASLHHLASASDHKAALLEAYRVLKPGGMLFITVFNMLRLSFRDKTVWRYRSYPLVRTLWSGRPLYYYAFTARRLKRLCGEAGFRIDDTFYAGNGMRAYSWNGRNLVVIAKK